jgi:hypothetical protein
LALALSLWSRHQHKNEAPSQPPAPTPSAGANAGSSAALIAGDTANPVRETMPNKNVIPVPSASSPSVKNVSAAPPAIAATTPAGEFTVVILAHEDSWLSITADGKIISEETLLAENQRAIHGQKEVVIRAGNTGGLDFVFNGKKLASQGDYGEVKTLTFGSGGLQPSVPAPSAPR